MGSDIKDSHDEAVTLIAANVRKFYDQKGPFRIYHGSTNSTRPSQRSRDRLVDTSAMSRVLKVDTERKTALVEPNVPMDGLVEATLQHGLIPPVVMEFCGITLGGGFSGTSGESSSFRFGYFDRTINWIEIVLENGETVIASHTERPDLFYGAASSFGTLGVTTLLEIQLIDARSYVELSYHPVSNMSEAVDKMKEATNDTSTDYLDGIMYSHNSGVICTGKLTNEVNEGVKVRGFTRSTDPWFYLHAKKLIKNKDTPVIEAIPIVDYLFRYDRGGFWFMHTRIMYHAFHKSGFASHYVVQDVTVPYPKTGELFQYLDDNFGHYPVWLCPIKINGKSTDPVRNQMTMKTNRPTPEHVINFGVWGLGSKNRREFADWNRDFEQKVYNLGGEKCLYAHTYYTKKEFDEIYDRKTYDALREKYHATHLPSVYDKVKVDIEAKERALQESWRLWISEMFWKIWPLAGLYGVYYAVRGGDYLLPKRAKEKKKV